MPQENLLPGTKAITRSTAEMVTLRGTTDRILVRYKLHDGVTWQRKFTDPDEAHTFFFGTAVPAVHRDFLKQLDAHGQ
jgi:hypothetical protein